ncbi:TPA: hypothetical protein ACH3X3_010850 [Trebouxia sp. C0006]
MKMRLKPSMEMQLVQHSASGTAELIAESRSFHASLSSKGSSNAVLPGMLYSIGTFLIHQLWRATVLLYFMQGLFCLAQLSQPSQLQLKIRQRLPCPCDCQLTGSTGCVSMSIPAQILHQIGPLNEVVLSLSDKNKVGRTVLYIPNLVPPYMDPW